MYQNLQIISNSTLQVDSASHIMPVIDHEYNYNNWMTHDVLISLAWAWIWVLSFKQESRGEDQAGWIGNIRNLITWTKPAYQCHGRFRCLQATQIAAARDKTHWCTCKISMFVFYQLSDRCLVMITSIVYDVSVRIHMIVSNDMVFWSNAANQ